MPFWPTFLSLFAVAWAVSTARCYVVYRLKLRDRRLVTLLIACAGLSVVLAGVLSYSGGPLAQMAVPGHQILSDAGVAPWLTWPLSIGGSCLMVLVSASIILFLVSKGQAAKSSH